MVIKIDCWYRNDKTGYSRLDHLTLTEEDIFDMLKTRFDNDELSIPMYLNKDEITPEFQIDAITI